MRRIITVVYTVGVLASRVAAQDTTTVTRDSVATAAVPRYRDPHKARVLATILPGAGYVYTGQYLRGYFTLVGTIGGISLGTLTFMLDACALAEVSLRECRNPPPEWIHQALGLLMIGEGTWMWIAGVLDAPHAAERANARHQRKKLKVSPIVEPSTDSDARLHVGVAVHW